LHRLASFCRNFWFDRSFHGKEGPAQWANAGLVRYVDDFVIVARYIGPRMTTWIQERIEERPGLEINREKTRTIPDLRGIPASPSGWHLRFFHFWLESSALISDTGRSGLFMQPT
jgi:hypothetical protein